MKKYIFFLLIIITAVRFSASAQSCDSLFHPFRGTFENADPPFRMVLDLYNESITVPGMSFFGPVGGYLSGQGIYGTWLTVNHKIQKDKAIVRFSSDTGADSQTIELTVLTDSTLRYRAIDGNMIKRARGRKLVKIGNEYILYKVK